MMDKPKVLIIDDERGPRESLRMILKDEYEVALAEGPQEGLRTVESFRPDVVFLDIRMPQMDGTEVLRRIKEIDPEIEVAMVTAYAAVDSAQQAVRLGAIDYLTKPFGMAEVLRVAERALARRRTRFEEGVLLEQLQRTTRDLSDQVGELRRKSEFADLSTIFDGLVSAQHSVENQREGMARLRAIGEIAAEVAHDVDNYLSAILLRIELLRNNLEQDPAQNEAVLARGLQEIAQATTDSAHAISRISLMSVDPYQPDESVDLNEILQDAAALSAGQAQPGGPARLVWETGELPPLAGSPEGLRTAFMNVIINARQALEDRPGEIRLRSYREDDEAVVEISDTGVGIEPEVMERVTDPFFTTKGGGGTGLGLSIARKVIARHGGSLALASVPGQGTTVTVRLPLVARPGADHVAASAVPDVLVVDDDERLLDLIANYFQASGLEVQTAATGQDGWRRFEQYLTVSHRAPGVVVTDARLPDLPGSELARRVKEAAPATRVLLLSAYVNPQGGAENPNFDAILHKPFDLPILLRQVTELAGLSVR
jgi:signal transduction histidine kinase